MMVRTKNVQHKRKYKLFSRNCLLTFTLFFGILYYMPEHLLWYDFLYKPLYNTLIFLYTTVANKDMGLAVIYLTLLIRVVLLPFSIRAARSEHRLQRLEPIIAEIKKRYKYDIEKQREAIKRLLHKNNIGIFSNVFSILFQALFLLVLYSIFSSGLQSSERNVLYDFMLTPDYINPSFLNRFDLTAPYHAASLFAAGMVFFSEAIRKVRHLSDATTLEKLLLIGLPLGTYFFTILLPSSKAVFIATSVCFSLWIQFIKSLVTRFFVKDDELKQSIEELWTS